MWPRGWPPTKSGSPSSTRTRLFRRTAPPVRASIPASCRRTSASALRPGNWRLWSSFWPHFSEFLQCLATGTGRTREEDPTEQDEPSHYSPPPQVHAGPAGLVGRVGRLSLRHPTAHPLHSVHHLHGDYDRRGPPVGLVPSCLVELIQ